MAGSSTPGSRAEDGITESVATGTVRRSVRAPRPARWSLGRTASGWRLFPSGEPAVPACPTPAQGAAGP